MRTVENLNHGGIMANYQCNAACRHCLYACSPSRSGGYINKQDAENICVLLREGGCQSVHIGGGEPFLNFDGLLELLHVISNAGIVVEYIETNAFWVKDEQKAAEHLHKLKQSGADTLCISTDPFHAEYVPADLPLKLADICHHSGFRYFLWQEKFVSLLSGIDKICTRLEMECLISPDYIFKTAQNYGLLIGGRAVNIETEYVSKKPVEFIIDSRPCRRLLSSNHFHVDLSGNFIPPGCTGIAIPLQEAIRGIPESKYPVFEALLTSGTYGLLEYARGKGFVEDREGYTSKCALCFYIRHWLCENAPSPELDAEHYMESLKYYD
jgi:hypothetical protein